MNNSSRILLRYTLLGTLALVGLTGRPGTVLAQGTTCGTAPFVAINPASPPRYSLPPGSVHFFRVTMPSLGQLTITTENAAFDTYGALYYPDGRLIAASHGDWDFWISRTSFLPGTYCISVQGASSSGTGLYWLRVDGDLATDTPGGSHLTNASVVRSDLTRAKMAVYTDLDYFQIQVPPGVWQVTVGTQNAAFDTYGALYYPDGRLIAESHGDWDFWISRSLAGGIYYVKVQGAQPHYTGDYWLKVSGVLFPPGTCAGVATTIIGTEGPDIINGTAGNDVIQALGGNDTVYGFGGNDRICGGVGDDVLVGGEGNDALYGEIGTNVLRGENGADYLYGGTGVDILDGGGGIDRLYGYAGNDVLVGGSENDFLYGLDGNDIQVGGGGTDVHDGGLNKDVCDKEVTEAAPLCEIPFAIP